MNRKDLINDIDKRAGNKFTKGEIDSLFSIFVESIKKSIPKDGKIKIIGFGSFCLKRRKARTIVNPKTREKISIPARISITFKAASGFVDEVQNAKIK